MASNLSLWDLDHTHSQVRKKHYCSEIVTINCISKATPADTLSHLQAMAAMEDLLTILTVDTLVILDTLPTMDILAILDILAIMAILATQLTPADIILPTMGTMDKGCIKKKQFIIGKMKFI